MINKDVIDSIYKKYKSRPARVSDLDLHLLFEYAIEVHEIYVDGNDLVIGSIDPASPFNTIGLDRVHAILEFENEIAIVMHSSIIFLNKRDSGVNVHIKSDKPGILAKLRERLS